MPATAAAQNPNDTNGDEQGFIVVEHEAPTWESDQGDSPPVVGRDSTQEELQEALNYRVTQVLSDPNSSVTDELGEEASERRKTIEGDELLLRQLSASSIQEQIRQGARRGRGDRKEGRSLENMLKRLPPGFASSINTLDVAKHGNILVVASDLSGVTKVTNREIRIDGVPLAQQLGVTAETTLESNIQIPLDPGFGWSRTDAGSVEACNQIGCTKLYTAMAVQDGNNWRNHWPHDNNNSRDWYSHAVQVQSRTVRDERWVSEKILWAGVTGYISRTAYWTSRGSAGRVVNDDVDTKFSTDNDGGCNNISLSAYGLSIGTKVCNKTFVHSNYFGGYRVDYRWANRSLATPTSNVTLGYITEVEVTDRTWVNFSADANTQFMTANSGSLYLQYSDAGTAYTGYILLCGKPDVREQCPKIYVP